MRPATVRTVIAIAALSLLAFPGSASAHHLGRSNAGDVWRFDNGRYDRTIELYFIDGFPADAEKRARTRDGAAQWSNVAGPNEPTFVPQADPWPNFQIYTECNGPTGGTTVHWRDLDDFDANWLGATSGCGYVEPADQISSRWVAFDSDRNWYTGVGDASDGFMDIACGIPPDCENDWWSVASHEFGHAVGLGHFDEDDAVCPNSDARETMCPSIYIGTERQRSIEAHERASFLNLYPG